MARKKLHIYLLLALVIAVWGGVIYRVSSNAMNSTEVQTAGVTSGAKKAKIPLIQPDTFNLLINYPDPFGENIINVDSNSKATAMKKISPDLLTRNKISEPSVLQSIGYAGYVKSESGKKRIAILTMEGIDKFIEEGASFGKVKLIAVLTDSVKVKYNGKMSFIKRKK